MLTIVTHDGAFHTDDIFGVATLSIILEDQGQEFNILRTRNEEDIANADYVVDVGGVDNSDTERFDHHQEGGAGVRRNGIPYASFGLVWKKYGPILCKSETLANLIDIKIVAMIDAFDNGIFTYEEIYDYTKTYTIIEAMMSFRPTWNEEQDFDRNFLEAVQIAKQIIRGEVKKVIASQDAEKQVKESLDNPIDKHIAILDCYCPFENYTEDYPDIYYVVYGDNSKSGNWAAKAVRDHTSDDMFSLRMPFPEQWAGKRNKELEDITGIKGSVFCHNNRFIAIAETKESVIEMTKKALEINKQQ